MHIRVAVIAESLDNQTGEICLLLGLSPDGVYQLPGETIRRTEQPEYTASRCINQLIESTIKVSETRVFLNRLHQNLRVATLAYYSDQLKDGRYGLPAIRQCAQMRMSWQWHPHNEVKEILETRPMLDTHKPILQKFLSEMH